MQYANYNILHIIRLYNIIQFPCVLFLEKCLDIAQKKLFLQILLIFGRGFIKCHVCGSIVFPSAAATATIICIHSKTQNLFQSEKNLPRPLWLSFCNFDLVILTVILTLVKQIQKCYLKTPGIIPVVKMIQEQQAFHFGHVIFKLVLRKGVILQGLRFLHSSARTLQYSSQMTWIALSKVMDVGHA